MKTSLKKFLIFVVAGCLYLAGQYLRFDWWPDTTWPFSCHRIVSGSISYCDPVYADAGLALIFIAQILATAGLILLFANTRALNIWFFVSLAYIPLASVFTWYVTIGVTCIIMCGGSLDYVAERMFNLRLAGDLYILITLVIVLLSWWRARKPA